MVVQRYALEALLEHLAEAIELGGSVAIHLERDQARDGQRPQGIGLAEPGFEQLRGVGNAQGSHRGNAGLRGEKARYICHDLVDVGTVTGLDLYRHLAGDIAQPSVSRLVHHVDRAGGEAGKKAHDGDNECQRAPGHRSGGHDWRIGLRLVAPAGPRPQRGLLRVLMRRRTPTLGVRRRTRDGAAEIGLEPRTPWIEGRRPGWSVIRSGHDPRAVRDAAPWSAASAGGRAWR